MIKKILYILAFLTIACNGTIAKPNNGLSFYWGNSDIRYHVGQLPTEGVMPFSHTLWRGERAFGIAIISSDKDLSDLSISFDDLKGRGDVIKADMLKAQFVRSVYADAFTPEYHQCGERDSLSIPRINVYDILDIDSKSSLKAGEYLPVWISIKVPYNAASGVYSSRITLLNNGRKIAELPFKITVSSHLLDTPNNWEFHLDLWQNPYAVARYDSVKIWSKEHFEKMTPVFRILSDAGQKVITTTITNRPWNGQTEDAFGSMVVKVKQADGTWMYDYSVFDGWVEYMMSLGIDKQINCYSLITWASSFDYFDAASSSYQTIDAKPGSEEYKELWRPFILDFRSHLLEKGWFDLTTLAMDESKIDDLLAVTAFINETAPDFKMSLAGWMHPEVEGNLDYLSVTFHGPFTKEIRKNRKEKGQISTFYTCCDEKFPNTFLACQPSEAEWIPVYAAANEFDGYLRWAYNSWTRDPLKDGRFRLFAAGDCFLVYPDGRSSIRMDKLIAGIQLYEKIQHLKTTLDAEDLTLLENSLSEFTFENLDQKGASDALNSIKCTLDTLLLNN